MKKRGLIITNAFSFRDSAQYQCNSLIKSFFEQGIELVHKTNEELLVFVNGKEIFSTFDINDYDFAIYLDKDKYISLMLSKLHLPLFNSHEAIDICDDKMLTHIVLSNNGIKMPITLSYPLCYEFNGSLDYLKDIKKHLTYPFIIKENYGSLGHQVYLVNSDEELLALEEQLRFKPHIYQEYIKEACGVDYRLILVGHEVVSSMKRVNEYSFKANVAQGGKGYKFEPNEVMKSVAIAASKVLNLDYCAIDFVIDKEGNPILIEVNSNAYFTEIEKVNNINISDIYAKHVIEKVYKQKIKS